MGSSCAVLALVVQFYFAFLLVDELFSQSFYRAMAVLDAAALFTNGDSKGFITIPAEVWIAKKRSQKSPLTMTQVI
jgi:hypothetical protein